MAKTASKSSLLRKFSLEAAIFRRFDVFPVWLPHEFQVQAKISLIRPTLPDYLSVSYDYVIKYPWISGITFASVKSKSIGRSCILPLNAYSFVSYSLKSLNTFLKQNR